MILLEGGATPSDRERAGQELLDAAPIPIADWLELKQDLLDARTPPPRSTAALR